MFKSALFATLLVCAQLSLASDNSVVTTNEAGARADSSTVINGALPSPAIGLPPLAGALPPQLFQQLPPPPYVLFGRLLDETAKFGDVVITGKADLEQFTLDAKTASATFAPSPQFLRYKKAGDTSCGGWSACSDESRSLSATFKSRFAGNVRWLGTVMVSSKNGAVLIPPADKQFVWEILKNSSTVKLGSVVIVPVPQGYGINVGVTSDGSALGLTSTLAKIASIFIGIGPSISTQNGTTMVTGSWSQQYLILEEDAGGIPFVIDLVTPQDDGTATKRDAELRRQVDAARQQALRAAEEAERVATRRNAELEAAMAKLQAEQPVPVPVVEPKAKPKRRAPVTTPPCVCEKKKE